MTTGARFRGSPASPPVPTKNVDGGTKPARLRPPHGSPSGIYALEASLGRFDRQDRRRVAVVMTTDGRRVHVPVDDDPPFGVSLLALLRSLPGLDGLLELITGSRRENGGMRRDER